MVHILSGCQVCNLGIQYHQCSTYRGLWGLVVVRLLWLSGRVLAAQASVVLGLTPGDCGPFHFPLFLPHNFQREARCSEVFLHFVLLARFYNSIHILF